MNVFLVMSPNREVGAPLRASLLFSMSACTRNIPCTRLYPLDTVHDPLQEPICIMPSLHKDISNILGRYI